MAVDARPLEAPLTSSRTLVIAPNWVGDNVMALPVFEALAESGRSLSILARPHLESLFGLVSAVDEVLVRDSSDAAVIRTVKSRGFEEAIILPNSFRSAWIGFRARIPMRWGYRSDFRGPLLEPAVKRPAGVGHQVADYDVLLERLGAALPSGRPRLDLSEACLAAAEGVLGAAGLGSNPGVRKVGVFPGAEFGPSKRWPLDSFAELVRALLQRPQVEVVIVAGPGEEGWAETVQGSAGHDAPIIGPSLDLGQLAGVLAHLDVLVTNDSGPMHIAAATGTPCVALFGPTNPTRTAPLGERHRVLYTNRWCSPCFKKRCPLFHQRCLRDLGVDQVLVAVTEILGHDRPTRDADQPSS